MVSTDQLVRLLLGLTAINLSFGDDNLGPPISAEEIASALANSSLTGPPPAGDNAIENSGMYEGDIVLTPVQAHAVNSRSAIRGDIWVNAQIPYTISSAFTTGDRQVIARAMAEYEAMTCIKFVGRTSQSDYINIIDCSGCWSYVGRIGGKQDVSLQQKGCVHFGIVIHEFMHASGFNHEQSRYDRDDYVIINWQNIQSGKDGNFRKAKESTSTDLGLGYDYKSVMHYDAYAFSVNKQPTITSKKVGQKLGQRSGFSELDVTGLNLLYECAGSNCIDKDDNCNAWVASGECGNYPDYMQQNCPKACDLCEDVKKTTPEPNITTKPTLNCKTLKKCKKKKGACQPKSSTCSGKIYNKGCSKKAGCVCCIPNKSNLIKLTKDHIIDHGGYSDGGAGPEHLLVEDGYWNPNPDPWFVTFDFGKKTKVNRVKIRNFGDSIHDVTSFSIKSSNDNSKWTLVAVIEKVAVGNEKSQFFSLFGEAQFWKLTVERTASPYQPWVRSFGFFGDVGTLTKCKNKHKKCSKWSNMGYCYDKQYKAYMEKNCPKACKFC